jgi:NADH dehydrogenase
MKPRIAITGAGGFLGLALARRLLEQGAEVHALARRPVPLPGVRWHAYDLGAPVPASVDFAHLDGIVHAAFNLEQAGPAGEQLNLSAAHHLHSLARRHQRLFVFVSSMSAHAGAVSAYGRAKWRIEQLLDPAVDAIVRPGLIIGPGGVYARMLTSLRRSPVLPVFFGGVQPVQPAGLADIVTGLERILAGHLAGTYNLGSIEPITIRELYARMLAATGLHRRIVPLPGDATIAALRLAERLGLKLPLTVENLLGQKHLRSFATADSFARLGLTPTPLDQLPWTTPSPPP